MKWFLDVAYIALGTSYKWLLGMMVIVGVVVGGLFAAGVFGGGNDSDDRFPILSATPVPTVTPAPRPTPAPTLEPTATPAPKVEPTLAPTAAPTPTPVILLPVEFKVPINLKGAANVGSLEFVLSYEPAVLKVTGVEIGALADGALLQSSMDTPGVVWAAMVDANGISGDGPAAVITFTVVGDSDAITPLELERVAAYDATTLLDLVAQASPGSYAVKNGALSAPSLVFVN